jgi:hypothetical protein
MSLSSPPDTGADLMYEIQRAASSLPSLLEAVPEPLHLMQTLSEESLSCLMASLAFDASCNNFDVPSGGSFSVETSIYPHYRILMPLVPD